MSQPAKAKADSRSFDGDRILSQSYGTRVGTFRGPLVPFPPLQISSADKNRANPVSLVTVSASPFLRPTPPRQLGLTLTRKLGDGRQRQENTQTSAVPYLVLFLLYLAEIAWYFDSISAV